MLHGFGVGLEGALHLRHGFERGHAGLDPAFVQDRGHGDQVVQRLGRGRVLSPQRHDEVRTSLGLSIRPALDRVVSQGDVSGFLAAGRPAKALDVHGTVLP